MNKGQDTRESSNRRQSVLPGCQQQVLTPSEWNHKCQCTDDGRCDRGHNFTL